MRNPLKKRITLEIGAWFMILAVIPLALSNFVAHRETHDLVIQELTAHLKDIIHEKVERIELYVHDNKQSVALMAMSPSVVEALQQSCRKFPKDDGRKSLSQESPAFSFLRGVMHRQGYHDIFLINPAGDIVYSLAQEDDLGTNLRHGPYKESGLALVFDQATTLLDTEISTFSFYQPSDKAALFIGAPVFDDKQVIGAIAVQINEDQLHYIFTDYIGLGVSGELVAGSRRPDGAIVAAGPLRHRPEALLAGLVLTEGAATPIGLAVRGQKGAGLALDYRGREVVAAWDYVPSMDWGLVVKIDRDEAFVPVYRQALAAGLILLVTILLVLTGIFFATTSITESIRKLTSTVQSFASGDFGARSEINEENEVGILADHFNTMARSIEQYTFSMQEQVERRTKELEQAKNSLNLAQKIAHVGSWEWNIVDNHLAWSDEIYRIFGLEPQQFAATYEAFLAAVHPDDRDLVTRSVQESLEKDILYSVDHRVVRPDGTIRFVHETAEIHRDASGTPLAMLGTVQDVTNLRQAQRQLYQYVSIVDENVLTSATDLEGTITYASDAFCRTCGYEREELLGKNHRILRHPDMAESLYQELWETITTDKTWCGVIKNKKKDGTFYWVEVVIAPTVDDQGKTTGYTAIHRDITAQKRLERISITDELTGLFNRRHFNDLFPQEMNRARRDGKIFAFMMIDVDFFKKYNDTYGHQKGDEVLRKVGVVLKEQLKRSGDFAFRLGGEEFGVTLAVQHESEAFEVAERLRMAIVALQVPHRANSAAPHVTTSCGLLTICADKDQSLHPDTIYRLTDETLYRAKEAGRNCTEIYSPERES